jgi:hypothetical protein
LSGAPYINQQKTLSTNTNKAGRSLRNCCFSAELGSRIRRSPPSENRLGTATTSHCAAIDKIKSDGASLIYAIRSLCGCMGNRSDTHKLERKHLTAPGKWLLVPNDEVIFVPAEATLEIVVAKDDLIGCDAEWQLLIAGANRIK